MRVALLAFLTCVLSACSEPEPTPSLDGFSGVYGQGHASSDTIVNFEERDGVLLMHPALWSGPMALRRITADSFVVAAHPRFTVAFGAPGRARVTGLADDVEFARLEGAPRAIQLLLDGRARDAARAYMSRDPSSVDQHVDIGRQFHRSAPSRVGEVVEYLAEFTQLAPEHPGVHYALAGALMASGDRAGAEASYRQALELDPDHAGALGALVRMGAEPSDQTVGWQLPFPLDSLFRPRRPSEIQAVIDDWAARDLDPIDPEIVMRREIDIDGSPAEARFVAHTVHGQRHVGVVIVPHGAKDLPVLVEAKGVSPDFSPMEVPDGLTSPFIMAESRSEVIYVAPGYRGERIIVGTDTLQSEGDPRNAWDGATDDLIAFLRVALAITPEADASRICVFGRSRGGTVAMLAGMRESQIDCVVSWAAPTDWFDLMGKGGWTQQELVDEGLRNRANPNQVGGQVINVFLADAVAGTQDLAQSRARMIAGSPLYFAELLGRTQAHWGIEDPIVPVVNGREFEARYREAGVVDSCLETIFHAVAGHDQDRHRAPILSREFLLRSLAMADQPDPCRTARP